MMIFSKNDIFSKIRNDSANNFEFAIEVLKFRGFLIDEIKGEWLLSDNGHIEDSDYLNRILNKFDIGDVVQNGRINIHNPRNISIFIDEEFSEKNRVAIPSCWENRSWSYFKNKKHGYKVPVASLEPFIARYVKAISACCVLTVGSCDGNHENSSRMYVMLEGEGSALWNELLVNYLLKEKFALNWSSDCQSLLFNEKTKYNTYYELNKAAEFLYEKREEIRNVKEQALCFLNNSFLKNGSSSEVGFKFESVTSKLLDELFKVLNKK